MQILTRSELSKLYNINSKSWTRRHDDIMNHLNEYMRITEVKKDNGYYEYRVYEEYLPDFIPALPRKGDMMEKAKEYTDYTIASLGVEFKPNSKSFVSRNAMTSFGMEKYGHINQEAIVKRYVGPVMDEKGEKTTSKVWVWYTTYEKLDEETVQEWRSILTKHHIGVEEAANAFYESVGGKYIKEKYKNYYKNAMDEFKEKYGDIPVLVNEWRLKRDLKVVV